MDGLSVVSKQTVLNAIAECRRRKSIAKEIQDKGINLLYEKKVTNGSWWSKFRNGNKTPYAWAREQIPMFCTWEDILHTVLSRDELDEVFLLSYGYYNGHLKKCLELASATSEDVVMLSTELCGFVNEFKGESNGV